MEKRLIFELHQFIHLIKNYGEKMIKKHYPSITSSQLVIIKFLLDNKDKEIVQKDIENEFHLGKSTVSSILDTMEKNKLICRVSSLKDGRKKIIVPDYKNLPTKQMVHDSGSMIEAILFKDIPDEKIQIFYEVLHHVNQNIEQEGEIHV